MHLHLALLFTKGFHASVETIWEELRKKNASFNNLKLFKETKVYLLNSYTTIKNIILNGGSSSLIVDYPMKILTNPFDLNQLNFDASIECRCYLRWDNGGGGGRVLRTIHAHQKLEITYHE